MYIINNDFDIHQIYLSGQAFRIYHNQELNNYTITKYIYDLHKDISVSISQKNNVIQLDCSNEEYNKIWYQYFDFSLDYSLVKSQLLKTNDEYITKAINFGYGLRVLHQDVWEMIVSYIISQRNNITRIRNSINKLCQLNSGVFPGLEELYNISSNYDLQFLGYRKKYICDLCHYLISNNIDLNKVSNKNEDDIKKFLLGINGIGPKVCNCIMLYGFHFLDYFPIDVWISKIIRTYYSNDLNTTSFSPYSGIAQLYMFYYERYKWK